MPHFHAVQERPIVGIAPFQVHRLFHAARADSGEAAHGLGKVAVAARIVGGPTGIALAPVAAAETAEAAAETPAAPAAPAAPLREKQVDAQGRAYATGRRKDAVARVWLKPGSGKIVVNGREQEVYFARPTLRLVINQPFQVAEREGQYDVVATVKGGGLSGQAGAVKHGISQALTRYEPALRSVVKQAGFLTRDPRVVERKKYGKAKARRSFQFSKR